MPYSTTRGDPNDPDTTVLRSLWRRKEDVIAEDIKREKTKAGVISNRLSLWSMYICNDEMISEPQRLTPKITSSPIQTPETRLRSHRATNSLRFSDENFDTQHKNSLRWSDDSPKRGRLRPSTAPNSMNSTDSFFDNDNNDENYDSINDDNDINNNENDDDNDNNINIDTNNNDCDNLKQLIATRKKQLGLTINTIDKIRTSTMKASPSPQASPSPTFSKDGTRRVNYPNVSTKFLRKQSKMKHLQDRALDAIIFQEARLFQQRVTECIKEANLFAEVLGKSTRYKVVARDPKEDAYWDKIVKSNKEKKFPDELLPSGTARRLNKMSVQITDEDNNTKRLINIDKFFIEHSDLHMEMKVHGSLIPSDEINQISISNNLSSKRSKNQASMGKSQSVVSESLPDHGGTGKITFHDTNKKETHTRTRKDTLNDLKEVTDMIVVNVKKLEKQLGEFKSRGWNLGM